MDGKRNTIQRQLVYSAVQELNIHATAEQVYEYVIKSHPTISKATVYRNLSQLAEAGELLNIGNFYGTTHYDHNCHKHYHFMCEGCRRVYDVPAIFPDMRDEVADMDGFEIKGYNVNFHGICLKCGEAAFNERCKVATIPKSSGTANASTQFPSG